MSTRSDSDTLQAVASFRRGAGGSADPPRIVKCKSFALSVSSKGSEFFSVEA